MSLPSGKAVPEWAISAQGDAVSDESATARPRSRAKVARRAATRRIAATRPVQPDTVPGNSASASILPLSREYRERENAIEEKLRSRMNICNGC